MQLPVSLTTILTKLSKNVSSIWYQYIETCKPKLLHEQHCTEIRTKGSTGVACVVMHKEEEEVVAASSR
jgi:hypothetical protein